MKDQMKPCDHVLPEDVEYKEVVIIGNGPSGMVTSFMLAGNVPYLKRVPQDLPLDDMLRARLANVGEGANLYETDLLQLAEGLEGRSHNPLPLLMDNLLRPCTDMGIQADPLIEWRYEADKEIDHVVVGSGPPGGSWAWFPRCVRTLSPAAWLWLPPLQAPPPANTRLPANAVAAYCRRYVHACRLQKYFKCDALVTSVRATPRSERCPNRGCPLSAAYCVTGHEVRTGRVFRLLCARAVLGGGGARARSLDARLRPYSLHRLAAFQRALADLPPHERHPVLVVGGGVSGADGVLVSRAGGARVLHAHRASNRTLAQLGPDYPDYTQVYKMMMDPSGAHEDYTSLPHHVITDVSPVAPGARYEDLALRPKRVKLLDTATNQTKEYIVSLIGVFIGSQPDLSLLQTNCEKCSQNYEKIDDKQYKNHWHYLKSILGQSIQHCKSKFIDLNKCDCDGQCQCYEKKCQCSADGIGFGVDPNKPVDSKNPLAVDKGSHELLHAPKGLYALGPLTADNFVRFIPGGALAIVADIHKQKTCH